MVSCDEVTRLDCLLSFFTVLFLFSINNNMMNFDIHLTKSTGIVKPLFYIDVFSVKCLAFIDRFSCRHMIDMLVLVS